MRPDSTRDGPCLLPDYRAVMEAFANYVSTQRPLLQSPEDIARLMRPILTPCEQEQMHALLLDAKNGLIADAPLTTGLADRTQIHPREAFREAIRVSCSRLILVHHLCAAAHKLCWGYPFNRSSGTLGEWMPLVLACTTRGRWASSRRGSGLMRTAWTTWNGCGGRVVSFARAVASAGAGGLATDASCAPRAARDRR
jgi:hypothetical protein